MSTQEGTGRKSSCRPLPPPAQTNVHWSARWTIGVVALTAAASGSTVGRAAQTPDAAELYRRGQTALVSGDYRQAADLFGQAVAQDPDHLGYRLLLARACESDGRSRLAEEMLREIVKRQPGHREAALDLARRYAARQEHAEVVAVLQPIRPAANDCAVHRLRGAALYELGRLEEARRSLSRAVACGQVRAEDHRLLGDIHSAQDRFALAVEAYAQANRLGLDGASLHFRLATAQFRLGNYLGAVSRRAVQGGRAGAVFGAVYLIEGVPGEPDTFVAAPPESAIFHVQRAMDLGMDRPEVHLLRGDIWLEAGHYTRALAEYRAIEPRVPQAQRARFCHSIARALWRVGDPEGHVTWLEEAAEVDGTIYASLLCEAYVNVAGLHNQAGDLKKYIEVMRRAVTCRPESAALHYRLGNALWENGQQPAAVRRWRITLELEPDHPDRSRMLDLIRTTRSRKPHRADAG